MAATVAAQQRMQGQRGSDGISTAVMAVVRQRRWQHGGSGGSTAGRRRQAVRQQGAGDSTVAPVAAAVWRQQPAWQLGGIAASYSAAARREARWQRWWQRQLAGSVAAVVAVGIAFGSARMAVLATTGNDSAGGRSAAAERGWQPAWQQWRQHGKSTALVVAAERRWHRQQQLGSVQPKLVNRKTKK